MKHATLRVSLAPLALLAAAEPVHCQQQFFGLEGQDISEFFGLTGDRAGDLNADGVPDLLAAGYRVRAHSGSDGAVFYDEGYPVLQGFGFTTDGAPVSDLGDVDQDGHDDFLIGLPFNSQIYSTGGSVKVVSGATGDFIFELFGSSTVAQLGTAIDAIGDVNGDGIADFAASAPNEHLSSTIGGVIYVVSGKDGTTIRTLAGSSGYALEWFGGSMAAAGDLDLDGVCDLYQGNAVYQVQAYSGFNGDLLFTLDSPLGGVDLGRSLHTAGDVDQDGVPDLVTGAFYVAPTGQLGAAFVYSGASILAGGNPPPLYSHFGINKEADFGHAVSGGQDLDGDGVPDYIVTAWQCQGAFGFCTNFQSGYLRAYSGATGAEIFSIVAPAGAGAYNGFGASCAILGDVNGDGRPEFQVGSPNLNTNGVYSGMMFVYSSAPLSLAADETEEDLSIGGTQVLTLDAGASHAGEIYVLTGSATGIVPGLVVDGVSVPLNLDTYTLFLLGAPNQPPYTGTLGVLDGEGQASASIFVPAGLDPGLAGTSLHHAYVTLSASLGVGFASNAVPLHLAQ